MCLAPFDDYPSLMSTRVGETPNCGDCFAFRRLPAQPSNMKANTNTGILIPAACSQSDPHVGFFKIGGFRRGPAELEKLGPKVRDTRWLVLSS